MCPITFEAGYKHGLVEIEIIAAHKRTREEFGAERLQKDLVARVHALVVPWLQVLFTFVGPLP